MYDTIVAAFIGMFAGVLPALLTRILSVIKNRGMESKHR